MKGEVVKHIVFVAPNFYVVRNWLSSGLASLCHQELGLTPIFVTQFQDAEFTCHDGNSYKNYYFPLGDNLLPVGYPFYTSAKLHALRLIAFSLDFEYGSRYTMKLARQEDKYFYVAKIARALFPRGTKRRALVRQLLDSYKPKNSYAAAILDQLDCQCIIVGTPGFWPLDEIMMTEASRRRIPTHCIINSWDNMTSRGPMTRRPQTLIVWNAYMKDMADQIHQYPLSQTFVVGALQFSLYDAEVTSEETDRLYSRIGLPRNTPYLLYFTGQHFAQYEAEDITVLARILPTTRYAEFPLVIRLHPQADVEPFRELLGPNVILDYAPRFSDRDIGGSRFDRSEIRNMGTLIHHAKVVISSWGTTALLEAAIFDKPTLQLRWMDSLPRKYPQQASWVTEFQKYMHLAPFDATGSRHFCDDPQELESSIDYLFVNHDMFRRGRRAAVESLVVTPLSECPHRVVNVLKDQLSKS